MALAEGREPIKSEIMGRVESHRSSDLYWLRPDHAGVAPVFEAFKSVSMALNDAAFQFEIDGAMDMQLTRYDPGGHYEWHMDLAGQGNSRRKLSVSILLNDPSEFDGGGLQFFEATHHQPIVDLAQGDAVFFPSWCKHRVVPVTRGVRWSLVGWWTGPPFR